MSHFLLPPPMPGKYASSSCVGISPSPVEQPFPQWAKAGLYFQISPEFKLTLAEEYKNRTVKILSWWISDSHRELAVSDAASLNFSLET